MLKTWEAYQRLNPTGSGQYGEYTKAERDEIIAKVIAVLADKIGTLKGVAAEYDSLIRHMNAGGDFDEFMASHTTDRANQGEG